MEIGDFYNAQNGTSCPVAKLPHIETGYINNTKIMHVIISNSPFSATNYNFDVITLPRKNVCVNVELEDGEKNITPLDAAIMDAVYTLYCNGSNVFTAENVARVMAADYKGSHKISDYRIQTIVSSLKKLASIRITIDCTDEYHVRKVQDIPKDRIKLTTYLLPLEEIEVISGNQKRLHGYRLLKKPALYQYAETVKQIMAVPIELLQIPGAENTEEMILLKRALITKIELLRNAKNNVKNNYISYLYYDAKTGQQNGLFIAAGINPADNTPAGWKNKRSKLHKRVCLILDRYKQIGYIQGYDVRKLGEKKVIGVKIIID